MKRYPRITVYRAKDGWRWRMVAGGRVVAESGEAYTERNKCVRAMRNVFDLKPRTWLTLDGRGAVWSAGRLVRVRIEGRP